MIKTYNAFVNIIFNDYKKNYCEFRHMTNDVMGLIIHFLRNNRHIALINMSRKYEGRGSAYIGYTKTQPSNI